MHIVLPSLSFAPSHLLQGAGVNDFSYLRSTGSFGPDSVALIKAPDPPALLDFAAPPVDGPTGTHLIPATVPNRYNAATYQTKPDQTIYQLVG